MTWPFRPRPAAPDWLTEVRAHGPYVYACIGTDRSTGDSLGPLVGMMLTEMGVPHVFGTLENLLHAGNLAERKPLIERCAREGGLPVLAIDACLGRYESIGRIWFRNGPLQPGAGVGKLLPSIGDYFLVGTVNVGGLMGDLALNITRLALVYRMARQIAKALEVFAPAAQEVAASTGGAP